MKLNNKGWGLPHLLAGIAIIIAFLLVATFFTLRLNNWLEENGIAKTTEKNTSTEKNTTTNKVIDTTAKNYYVTKTNELVEATNKYITDEEITLEQDSTIQIQLDLLVNHNYLNNITDYYSEKACKGYSLIYLDSNYIKEIKSYIKCDNYETEGYVE